MSIRKKINMQLNINKKKGIFIIESILALVIFMIGILGIIKYQGETIIATSDSQYRINATFLADSLIGDMWIEQANINSFVDKSSSSYQAWFQQLESSLPGVIDGTSDTAPIITVSNGVDGAKIINITIKWKQPSSNFTSSYQVQSTIL